MKAKHDGAGITHTGQFGVPQLHMPTTEPEQPPFAPPIPWTQSGASIRWTRSAQEQAAATRHERIAVGAYYLAEARGFAPGHEAENWSIAEAQVDAEEAGTLED